MRTRLLPIVLMAALTSRHPAQALSPLPQENPDEICRQVLLIQSTSEALINNVLRKNRVNARSAKLYEKLQSEMGQLAFGWDTVVPFQADDLDGIAIAASNFVAAPISGGDTYVLAKSLVQELHRLVTDYGCS